MPTVIDSLLISLGVDTSKIQKDLAEGTKKTKEDVRRHAGEMSDSFNSVEKAVAGLQARVLGFLALLAGANGIKDFTQQLVQADFAIGRLATNLGSTPERFSAMTMAVERSGGSVEAAASSFAKLSDAFQEIKTSGSSAILPALNMLGGLGHKAIDWQNGIDKALPGIIANLEAVEKTYGHARAVFMGKQLGIDENTVTLMTKGLANWNAEIEKSKRLGTATKQSSEDAAKLIDSYKTLQQEIEGVGRTILHALEPHLLKAAKAMNDWVEKNHDWIDSKINEEVKKFSDWVDSIDWDNVIKQITKLGDEANSVAQALGGWVKTAEIFLGLWVGAKFAAVVANIAKLRMLLGLPAIGGFLGAGVAAIGAGALAESTPTPDPTPQQRAEAKAKEDEYRRKGELYGWRDFIPSWMGGTGRAYGHHGNAGAAPPDDRTWWQRHAPRFLGGRDAPTARHASIPDVREYTGSNAAVLRAAATDLGTSPNNLASVIEYETAGTFSPNKWGGAARSPDGHYKEPGHAGDFLGLIQFGHGERNMYGAHEGQTFAEQMRAVVRYLKHRGFKPGMGLLDLYSTINAGSPGRYGASDHHGTVRSHVDEMLRGGHAANVRRFLGADGSGKATPLHEHVARAFPDLARIQAGARAASRVAAAAQAARYETHHHNDNRQTSHSDVKVGQINISAPNGDPATIAKSIKPALERHTKLSSNYGAV